jgi:hypothetical protein
LLSFGGLAAGLASGAIIAWAGGRFFLDAKRQQDLELLMTTIVGGRNVLTAQWRYLRELLMLSFVIVLLIAIPSAISAWLEFSNEHYHDFWRTLPYLLAPVNLVVEVAALCWTGMYAGLLGRHPAMVAVGTVGLVQLIPLALIGGASWAWTTYSQHASISVGAFGLMPLVVPVLLLLLLKNVGFIVWARMRLRGSLRLAPRRKTKGGSSPRLVAQTA